MSNFSSSATGIYTRDTNYNSLVSSSATASATSNVSLENANKIAQDLANNLAKQTAVNEANVINQVVDIVNTEFIQPLQQFQNSVTSINNIRFDQVFDSLNAYKKAVYNVNYLVNLIKQNSAEIIAARDYSIVLKPIIEKEYYNKNYDMWIANILPDISLYFANKYPGWNNSTLEEIFQYNNDNDIGYYNVEILENTNASIYAYNELIQKYPNNSNWYYLSTIPWNNGLSLRINTFQKDIINPSNILSIGSKIDLSLFIPNTDDLSSFSPEYLTFIKDITNELEVLNDPNFNSDAIWPYINPVDFDNARCLYSEKYPYMTNQLISECYIKGSDVDYPSIVLSEIKDLYFNYPSLSVGDIAILTFNIGDNYYLSIVKIDTYNGTLCFKEKYIPINSQITNTLKIVNDNVIQGSLNVQTYHGENIIKTDNISKITTFNNKIGVNQETYNVKGLLDIDNLSQNSFLNILNDFEDPLLYSYDVTMYIKDQINYGDTSVSIPPIYQEKDLFVFKSPIQNLVEMSDIQFLFVSSDETDFASKTFTPDTFLRIQQIVNELNKMQTEYDLNTNTQSCLFSFIELLNDTNYWYVCCLRGVIKINPNDISKREIYFICSFLNINEYMINKSYTTYMTNLIDKMSSCNRLLNYSTLLLYDPNVLANLFKGQNISSSSHPNSPYFSDRINNSPYFRDRFSGKELYAYGFGYLYNRELENGDEAKYLFNERYSYYNNKTTKSIFKQETDISIFDLHNEKLKRYNSSYGDNKEKLSFIIKYNWTNGMKISVENVVTINDTKYMLGCGFNLTDVLDEAVIVKGDNVVTGNLSILDDVTKVPIFEVNREKKQTISLFQTGIGTDDPNASLDVNDTGMNDILNLINAISREYNIMNNNIALLKSNNINTIVSNFIDPVSKKNIVQSFSSYYFINLLNVFNPKNSKLNYSWLYPEWQDQYLNEIIDIQNQRSVDLSIINIENRVAQNLIFSASDNVTIVDWIFGKKIITSRNILLDDNKLYSISNGINLQTYNLPYYKNKNIASFMDLLSTLSTYFQYITASIYNIDVNQIPNYTFVNDNFLKINSYKYPFNSFTFKKIMVDINDPYKTTITSVNFDFDKNILITGEDTIELKNLLSINDKNTRFKYLNFTINLNKKFNNLKRGDYGVLSFEDENVDYLGLFFALSSDTFLCLDYQIDKILEPAVVIRGDTKIKGDLIIKDINKSNNENFLNVDPTFQFIGVNSDNRFINYPYSFPVNTTSNIYSSKQNFYIKCSTNPLLCCERITENASDIVNPSNDISKLVNDKSNSYRNFRSFSAATIRRKSNIYSSEEMYNYTLANSIQNNNFAKYGPEISVEITDKNDYTSFIGNFGMVIDKLDENKQIQSGFIIRTYDVDSKTKSYKTPRPIMYLENDSTLHVDNIVVGKTSPLSLATGPSNIKVDSITLDSAFNMYVKKSTDNNGNAIENLYWGNLLLGSQPVTETLINQALQNQSA
jgi:hypothetical protein